MSKTVTFSRMNTADIADVVALEERTFDDPWNRQNFEAELNNTRSTVLIMRNKQHGRLPAK